MESREPCGQLLPRERVRNRGGTKRANQVSKAIRARRRCSQLDGDRLACRVGLTQQTVDDRARGGPLCDRKCIERPPGSGIDLDEILVGLAVLLEIPWPQRIEIESISVAF